MKPRRSNFNNVAILRAGRLDAFWSFASPLLRVAPSEMPLTKRLVLVISLGVIDWACGVLILKAILSLFGYGAIAGFSGQGKEITPVLVVIAIGFAPLVESLIVWGLVGLLQSKLKLSSGITSFLTGALMAAQHGMSLGSLAVFPGFAVQAHLMFLSRSRQRSGVGYLTIVSVHLTRNTLAIIIPLLMH